MAENRVNIFERGSTIVGGLLPVGAAAVSVIVWLVHLEGSVADVSKSVVRIDTANADRDARWSRLEEARAVGLQRLATVEEGLRSQKEILSDIRAKLDRALTRR